MIENFKQNKKVLLVIKPGGGKSITAGSFIAKYHKIYKFVLIVRKRDLVEQLAKDALDTFGLDYSIFMAGHPKMDLNKSIQVCSKDTMQMRDILPFEGKDNVVIMVDEADEFPDYQREIIKRYSQIVYDYSPHRGIFNQGRKPRFFYFGMTATPYNGLDFFDVAIEPIKAKELLKRGILVPFDYVIPKQIDYSDVALVDGQWKQADIIKKLDHPQAIADSFSAWLTHGDNRQTLIFGINKQHSKNIVAYINNYYGKEVAIHCDADTPKEKREDAKNKFKKGIIRFISNIRLFTRGTNIIEIGTILDCASTLSLNNHIQKLGRGSRCNEFYKDCILIDVANNLLNLGHFYQEREIDLNSNYKLTRKDIEVLKMRVCEKCFRADEPQSFRNNICPFCGHCNKAIKKKKLSKLAKNKLFMESASEDAIEQRQMINYFKKRLWIKINSGNRYRKDIARELTNMDMLKKYGVAKMIKIQKATGLKQTTVDTFRRRNEYTPLEI